MADYSFGGSDEDNAELKKLNAEVVRFPIDLYLIPMQSAKSLISLKSLTALSTGRSLSAPQNLLRVVSTGTPALSQSSQLETYTIGSWRSSLTLWVLEEVCGSRILNRRYRGCGIGKLTQLPCVGPKLTRTGLRARCSEHHKLRRLMDELLRFQSRD